jgi:hypothetical protein
LVAPGMTLMLWADAFVVAITDTLHANATAAAKGEQIFIGIS